MLNTYTLKNLMADTKHTSWMNFYGNIHRSEPRDVNQTSYLYIDGKGKSETLVTNLTKSQFKDLALFELSIILTEAGNMKLQDLIDKVTGQPGYDLASDYSLEYPHFNKVTNEVEHKAVSIPVKFIKELEQDSKENTIGVFVI